MTSEAKPLWRDVASTITAFIIVIAFVSIGFVAFVSEALFGVEIAFDAGWRAAMLSLASTAFGFMVGRKSGHKVQGFDRPLCSTCPIRQQISQADEPS